MVVTEKCDVYSFGVVVLETIMGKHPGELISLLSSSSSTQNIMLKDLLDPRLLPPSNQLLDKNLLLLAIVAMACLCLDPRSRPTMQQVSQQFLVRRPPLVKPLRAFTMWELMYRE